MIPIEDQIRKRCVHFNGIQHIKCKAGIELEDVKDTSVRPYRWPC